MARYEIKNPLTPEGRNQLNAMFEELYREYTEAGDNARDAREKAAQAVADAVLAKGIAETTRQEMLDIIREQTQNGDLAPEIAQARGGHQVLGERLNSVDEQLAHTADQTESITINVKHPPIPMVGAKGDFNIVSGLGTDDTAAIKGCLSLARNIRAKLKFPAGTYQIKETLMPLLPYCNIYTDGQISPALGVHTGPGTIGIAVQIIDK